MRSILKFCTLGSVLLALGACEGKDTEVREWLHSLDDFNRDHVWPAICQLEADVYDMADSGGDTRTAGNAGQNRLCPAGSGDPPGAPPPPPPF